MALLLGFSNLGASSWQDWEGTLVSSLAYAYRTLWSSSWFVWLLLLGLYFPTRLSWDRRAPWMKWLLIVPHVLLGLLGTVTGTAVWASYALVAALDKPLAPLFPWLGPFSQWLIWGTVGLFFLTITAKYLLEHAPDARRRLRLFYAGMAVALLPLSALAVIGNVQGRSFDDYPAWIEVSCLVSTLAFPLTLAYLILVHKAVDVSVAIRQGLQYALARGGVMVLQGVLAAALVVTLSVMVTAHRTRLPVTIMLVAVAITLVLQLRRLMAPLARWIDRRFFREAYDAELVLAELSEKVRTMVEANPLLETVASRIANCLHVRRVAVLLESAGPYQPAYALGYETRLGAPFPNGGTVKYLRQNKGPARVYLEDLDSWVNTAPEVSDEERQSLAQLQSELLLPLSVKDRLLGFMSLSPKKSDAAYSRSDLRLLDSVAAQTALALEIARLTEAVADEVAQRERLNRELEIAREVQERLFPQTLPPVAGLDYAGACQPALLNLA